MIQWINVFLPQISVIESDYPPVEVPPGTGPMMDKYGFLLALCAMACAFLLGWLKGQEDVKCNKKN